MGISVKDSRLSELARLISEWPGLVSGPADHLIEDSLVLLEHLGDARTLVDVGSGGGLPGLPLKIARPDIAVTLVEADSGKAAFLVQACARLGLTGVEVLGRRVEDVGHEARYRESFDVAVARALAPLPTLVELCLPLVRIGGKLLAQKTDNEEVGAAERALRLLGGSLDAVSAAPSTARATGTVVVISKTSATPATYPRRPGIPARKPL